jgi:hypothetical protein
MRTALFLSSVAAALLAVSTATFAQNFTYYPNAYPAVTPSAAPGWDYTAQADRLTRSHLSHHGKVTVSTHRATRSHAPTQEQ